MTARTQGYLFVCITMCIWGGFTILSRLNLHWHVSAWDLVAMRFAIAFIILMPVLVYKKDSLMMPRGKRIAEDDEYFTSISRQWSDTLKKGLAALPVPSNEYFL